MGYGAWASIGLFAFCFVGFLMFYRELAEIKEAARVVDEAETRDNDVLQKLVTLGRALIGPDVIFVQGNSLFLHTEGGPVHIIGLPVRESRDIPEADRLQWHRYQLACIHAWNETGRPGKTETRDRVIGDYLADELPGIASQLKRLARYETAERKLVPGLEIQVSQIEDRTALPLPVAPPDASAQQDEPPVLMKRGKRVDPKTRKDPINIPTAMQFEFGTRPFGPGRNEADEDSHPSDAGDAPLSPVTDSKATETAGSGSAGTAAPRQGSPLQSTEFVYDEWDAAATSYRFRFCRVTENAVVGSDTGREWSVRLAQKRHTQREIERILMTLMPLPKRLNREPYGDDVDLDAYVRSRCDLIAGHSPDERIFERKVLRERSVSVTLLIDWSASTERWVGHTRAFDLGQESAALFAGALGQLGDPFSVYGFSGQGRDGVRVGKLKEFSEPWTPDVLERFGSVGPGRFTRIGAAIRHGASKMKDQRTAQRLLLVFSDAKPQDDDGYDGAYALADVRQAVREARRMGVKPFCLALGDEARSYLPSMFGRDWAVHDDPESLSERLAKLYVTLTCTG